MNKLLKVDSMTARFTRGEALSILAQADSDEVKALAEKALPLLGDIQVIKNRTGLVMLPYKDSAQGTAFHLGEVLVAEAHIQVQADEQGYGMVIGRDVVLAMGLAVLDACNALDLMQDEITAFIVEAKQRQDAADEETLKQVEATRVVMETF